MPKGLKRYYGRGDLHFLTFRCYRRRPFLGTKRARNRFAGILEEGRAFWQRRFSDINVRSRKKAMEKQEYRHENPMKRRLVSRAKDWPGSSWSHYAKRKRGLIEIDLMEGRNTQEEPLNPKGAAPSACLSLDLWATRPNILTTWVLHVNVHGGFTVVPTFSPGPPGEPRQ